ncbi:MAG TPA: hypothetical protein PKN54_10585 [Candidatus Cloacimonas acidaminovorans]|nr:hypothetical protein [Candidatus Cloacimonas acidaminovorans]
MGIIIKLLKGLNLDLAGLLGIIQAVLKVLKEALTATVNILFPVLPESKFKTIVSTIRGFVNKADDLVEKAKSFLLINAG